METAHRLLARIRTERRQRWETDQLANFEAKGKKPPKNWKDKYKEPEPVDDSELPELPEGWCWLTIGDLPKDEAYSFSIGPFGSNLKVDDYREKGVPLVFVREIRAQSFGDENTKYIEPEKALDLASHQVSPGDLLITKMGDPPGDTAIYPDGSPIAIITADCIKIAPERELSSSRFLMHWLRAEPMLERILAETKGVAQRKLSLKRFRTIITPMPPKLEQEEIIQRLQSALEPCSRIDGLLPVLDSTMSKLDQSILSKAFKGELVPQDPNDEPASELLARIHATREKEAAGKKATKKKKSKKKVAQKRKS